MYIKKIVSDFLFGYLNKNLIAMLNTKVSFIELIFCGLFNIFCVDAKKCSKGSTNEKN